mmetsp:Transcript_6164/g.13848  ORF Transcript_6164/g.13848 Transcript_6164/m.13848 type:complete len:82 (+) Transcript_6164:870-1115(+)
MPSRIRASKRFLGRFFVYFHFVNQSDPDVQEDMYKHMRKSSTTNNDDGSSTNTNHRDDDAKDFRLTDFRTFINRPHHRYGP